MARLQFTRRELFFGGRHYSSEDAIQTAPQTSDSSADPQDDQLMLDAQAGRPGSIEAVFQRYGAVVWRFFRRRVADPARAEELAQDVFTAVIEGLPRYRPTGAFRSYLFAIAYNVLLADRRKASGKADQPLNDTIPGTGADPDSAIWVQTALAQLEPGDREILMLREYEQLSYQEIADLQSVPLNTVRSRLFRARMALKQALVPDPRPQVQR